MSESLDRTAQSRAASRAALHLPDSHQGYTPASNEPWQSYEKCAGCGRLLSRHSPSQQEREEQGVIPGQALADGRLVCSLSCLYRRNPQDSAVKKADPASFAYDLRQLEIADLEKRLDVLKGGPTT